MKKILLVFSILTLSLSLCISFAGCSDKGDAEGVNAEFKAPENYSAKLVVTLNQKLSLYLDGNEIILAADCEKNSENYNKLEKELEGKALNKGIELIIKNEEENGNLSKSFEAVFDVQELKGGEYETKTEILNIAVDSAQKAAKGLNKTVKPTALVAGKAIESDKTVSQVSSETQSTVKEESKPQNVSSEKIESKKEESVNSGSVAEEKNPTDSLKKNTAYVIYVPTGEGILDEFSIMFDEAQAVYSQTSFSTEMFDYEEPRMITHGGKQYYECGELGDTLLYSVSTERISFENSFLGIKSFTVSKDGKLVVETLDSGAEDNYFKVGDVFSPIK